MSSPTREREEGEEGRNRRKREEKGRPKRGDKTLERRRGGGQKRGEEWEK